MNGFIRRRIGRLIPCTIGAKRSSLFKITPMAFPKDEVKRVKHL